MARSLDGWRDEQGKLPAYAWPGGYPLIYLDKRDRVMCPACANLPKHERSNCGNPIGGDVYWEGPELECDECGEMIQSAYGDPDAPDDTEPTEIADDGEVG